VSGVECRGSNVGVERRRDACLEVVAEA